ncbi:unnamed protein product, partial [Cladocopium goreaui]
QLSINSSVNVRAMYGFSFILQMVQCLAQSQYLDEYIFKVAEGISPHHGNLVVGTLESIAGVTKLLVAFPIGCVVDWRPASRTRLAWVALGLGCPTVVIGVLAILSGRLWMLTIMQVAFVIFAEFASCLAMAIFTDSLASRSLDQRTAAFANVQVFQNLGTAAGSATYALTLLSFQAPEDWTGFQTKSALLAGFALLVPVMLSLFAFPQAQKESKDLPAEQPEIQTEIKTGRAWVPYVVLLALLILALAAGMVFKFFPLFFINIYGMSVVQISVVQAIEPLVKACFTYLVGVCAPVVGRAKATSVCMVGVIGCLLGLSIQREEGTHLLSSLALFMFRGSLAQASFALAWAILMDCVPASQRGRWSSSCTVLNMSWSGAAVIAGELLDKHGYQYTFCIAAGLCAVALVVFSPLLLLKPQRLPSEPVEVSPNAKAHNAPKFERFESGAAEVVVVVDPFSTGGFLAAELLSQGCAVIALWTKESNIRYHDYPKIFDPRQLLAELDEEPTVEATAARLREVVDSVDSGSLAAVICGGDSGVNAADALSEALDLRGNGGGHGNRRDKLVQHQALEAAGLRFARTVSGTTWEQVAAFAETEQYPLVVKPIESAGADGFKLCDSMDEAREHFDFLNSSGRWCGAQGRGVLLQEFLEGTEYIVDHVSCDGVHKTTMLWMYDFQEVNGHRVCIAQRPVPCDSSAMAELVAYTRQCLNALGVRNGATHTEVMWTSGGPCLVEVNCRCQGGTGFWVPLCRKMTGYSQVDAVIGAYLRQEAFDALPNTPTFLMFGDIIHLISYEERLITDTAMPGLEAVRGLSSFTDVALNVELDKMMCKTTDWNTLIGVVALCHPDPAVLAAHICLIRSMET